MRKKWTCENKTPNSSWNEEGRYNTMVKMMSVYCPRNLCFIMSIMTIYFLRYLGINNFSLKRILFRFELVWTLDRLQRRKNAVWKLYRWGINEIPVYSPVYPQNTAVFQYIFQYIFLSSIFQYIPVYSSMSGHPALPTEQKRHCPTIKCQKIGQITKLSKNV